MQADVLCPEAAPAESVDWLDRARSWLQRALNDQPIDRADALAALTEQVPLTLALHVATQARQRFWGCAVQLHMLHNVQNGACPEDCGYCGQSCASKAPIQPYTLKSEEEILQEAARAKASGAYRYCMVLSGRGPDDRDIERMARCIRQVKERYGLQTCLSAGLLDEAKARRLKEAGLDRLNHNLNTSRAHYPSICTTHTYEDRLRTLRAARAAGLALCSGLIVGMGETHEDVVETLLALREAQAASIPVNFLLPIPGNRVAAPICQGAPLTPRFCLRVLCVARLLNPSAEIRVAAGREEHLRSLQAQAMGPANSLFVDGYLLTRGSDARTTLRMLLDAGCTLELPDGAPAELLEAVAQEQARCAVQPDVALLKEDRLSQRKLAKLRVAHRDAQPTGSSAASCAKSSQNVG